LNSLDGELHLARADVQPKYAVKQAGQSNTALHKVKDEHARSAFKAIDDSY
jgi:hypothetical protein